MNQNRNRYYSRQYNNEYDDNYDNENNDEYMISIFDIFGKEIIHNLKDRVFFVCMG